MNTVSSLTHIGCAFLGIVCTGCSIHLCRMCATSCGTDIGCADISVVGTGSSVVRMHTCTSRTTIIGTDIVIVTVSIRITLWCVRLTILREGTGG
ncbi:hypothetical protein K8942_00940 [Candidatus Peribacteria bacterium]|nr:MAG: hypothetical protein K8942_00940 [Candidatus Peribacteria bacterium]